MGQGERPHEESSMCNVEILHHARLVLIHQYSPARKPKKWASRLSQCLSFISRVITDRPSKRRRVILIHHNFFYSSRCNIIHNFHIISMSCLVVIAKQLEKVGDIIVPTVCHPLSSCWLSSSFSFHNHVI